MKTQAEIETFIANAVSYYVDQLSPDAEKIKASSHPKDCFCDTRNAVTEFLCNADSDLINSTQDQIENEVIRSL